MLRKLDYEDATSHDITVVSNDGSGAANAASSQTFTINVNNVSPTLPADDDATANAVNEGATGTVGIDVSSTDPNGTAGGGNVTFSLTNNAGGRFQIDATTGVVSVSDGSLLDGPTSHTITVQASDRTGGASTKDFMIDVTNVAPTANDDSYNADVFTFLQVDVAIDGPGVLGNDTDPAGATNDPLVVTTTGTIITAEGADR